MEWSRTETLSLARHSCTHCHGLGIQHDRKGEAVPCNCVLRSIFRACYGRFRQCASKEKYMSRISLDYVPGRQGSFSWGRKDEEYLADFVLVSQRTLDTAEYQIFKFHFLLGADWKLCCLRLSIDKGYFFHSIYRIEQKLGRIFRELEPYGLYPVSEYFRDDLRAGNPGPGSRRNVVVMRERAARKRLQVPIRKVA
jgi:hypothetical protein